MGRDTLLPKAAHGLVGAGVDGPASDRRAASPSEVSLVVVDTLMKYLSRDDGKTLLASSLLACNTPVAVQQQPCIMASMARCAAGNAVEVIRVRETAYPPIDFYIHAANSVTASWLCHATFPPPVGPS